MRHSRIILRIIFALGVWSFVLIGLFKLHGNHVVLQHHIDTPLSGRFLLQKDNKYIEATSTTTDHMPYDILIDNRQGMF